MERRGFLKLLGKAAALLGATQIPIRNTEGRTVLRDTPMATGRTGAGPITKPVVEPAFMDPQYTETTRSVNLTSCDFGNTPMSFGSDEMHCWSCGQRVILPIVFGESHKPGFKFPCPNCQRTMET